VDTRAPRKASPGPAVGRYHAFPAQALTSRLWTGFLVGVWAGNRGRGRYKRNEPLDGLAPSRALSIAIRANRTTTTTMLPEPTPKIKPRDELKRLYAMHAEGLIEPWDLPPLTRRRKPKKNQSSIIRRTLRAAVRAGLAPTGFRVGDNGEITVFTKVVEGAVPSLPAGKDVNEWDEVDGAA
jgi:hypothetical protein